jgi:HEAT repeat protein
MANSLKLQVDRLAQDPSLADWLIALSHDSPFEPPQGNAARGVFCHKTSPPLTAVESLLSLLKDSNRAVRLRAITALGDLAGEIRRVQPALHAALREAALNEGDDGVRAEAVRALLRAGPQSTTEVGALVDSLQSDIDVVRFHAAIALGNLGAAGRPAVPGLIRAALWDEDPAVRLVASMALWKVDRKGPLVVPALIKALDDANELICWIAVEFLGQMGPAAQKAVPALQQTLQRGFRIPLIKTGVILALERIVPQATGRDELSAVPIPDPNGFWNCFDAGHMAGLFTEVACGTDKR